MCSGARANPGGSLRDFAHHLVLQLRICSFASAASLVAASFSAASYLQLHVVALHLPAKPGMEPITLSLMRMVEVDHKRTGTKLCVWCSSIAWIPLLVEWFHVTGCVCSRPPSPQTHQWLACHCASLPLIDALFPSRGWRATGE